MYTIYHNPRCSKSRQTLQLLNDANVPVTVVEYLKTPPSAKELQTIIGYLGFSDPRQLMRQKDDVYKSLNLKDQSLTEDTLIAAMVNEPKLIERPIVVFNNEAVMGRPPENVNKLLPSS